MLHSLFIIIFFRSVYPLNAAPQYNYTTPLFDTWTGIPNNDLGDWDIRPGNHIEKIIYNIK